MKKNLQGSYTNCFCPLSFHEETAIMDLSCEKQIEKETNTQKLKIPNSTVKQFKA